ncbi:MAG: mechanosensitive ion channel domain-containing protein [Alphaproteobacteria bacterium]
MAAILAFAAPGSAVAQDTAAAAKVEAAALPLSDLEGLAATIEDDKARAKFLRNLRAAIAAGKQGTAQPEDKLGTVAGLGTGWIFRISAMMRDVSAGLVETVATLRRLPEFTAWARHQVTDPRARGAWIGLITALALVLIIGVAAEWGARRLLAVPRQRLEARESPTLLARAGWLTLRTVLDLVPLAAFAVAAYGTLTFAAPAETARLVTLAVINAYVLARAIMAVARILIAPRAPNLRLFPIGDATAFYLIIWVRRLAYISVYGYFAAEAARLLGLAASAHDVVLKLIGLVVATMLVILTLQNRSAVASAIRGAGATDAMGGLRARLADIWHVLIILYVAAVYSVWILEFEGGFEFLAAASGLTLIILVGAKLVVSGLMAAVDRGFRIRPEVKAQFPGLEARANRYLPVLRRVLRSVVYIVAAIFLLQSWGMGSFDWLTSDAGLALMGKAFNVAIILFTALVFWEGFSLYIERVLTKIEDQGSSRARTRTLLPLVRNGVLVVMVVLVGMVVLSEIGVNIGPLLAGAGVVGLAIGFGAQKLVQDIITGLFILVEDTMAVGDVVRLGDHSGVVESMSIRSIRLRDLSGSVHTLPFSEVSTILNLTKDFSYYLMEVGIAYREDVDHVIEVLGDLGGELQADDNFGPFILEPLQVLGLDKFADSAIIIKARIKTEPAKQWMVGREFNRRMKIRFDELGIEIPFPHMTLYLGEDKAGQAPPLQLKMAEGDLAEAVAKAAAAKPARAKREERAPADRTAELPEGATLDGGDGE